MSRAKDISIGDIGRPLTARFWLAKNKPATGPTVDRTIIINHFLAYSNGTIVVNNIYHLDPESAVTIGERPDA